MLPAFTFRARKNRRLALWAVLLPCLGGLAFAPALRAQIDYEETNVTLTTIGGGPPPANFCAGTAGFVDGPTLENSQFDGPVALALNSQATLFIADFSNNAVRMVTFVGDTANSLTVTSPVLTNMNKVVGVAVDAGDNLYVLTRGDKALRKFNYSLNLLFSNVLPLCPRRAGRFARLRRQHLCRFHQRHGPPIRPVRRGPRRHQHDCRRRLQAPARRHRLAKGRRPGGERPGQQRHLPAGRHEQLRPLLYLGGGANGSTPGWVDGIPPFAEFNQPSGLAWSPDGQLVVADRLNNAVRRIDASGTASTIYGVSSNLWGSSDCHASPAIFAGWVDGAFGAYQTNATGDAPAAVLLDSVRHSLCDGTAL